MAENMDKMDGILKNLADQADAGVDYAAMRAAIEKKRAQKRAQQARFIRYGSMAAAAAIVLGVGALYLARGSGLGNMAKSASPAAYDSYATTGDEQSALGALMESSSEEMIESPSAAPEGQSLEDAAPAPQAAANDAGDSANREPSQENGGANGTDSASAATAPPLLCGGAAAGFGWQENGLSLPAIDFGTDTQVESDETRFLCTVTGCTQADFDGYVASLAELYPPEGPQETSAPGEAPRQGWDITAGCSLTVEAKLDGDTLTLLLNKK